MKDDDLILVTSGEPAGIGPEITTKLCEHEFAARIVALGDPALLADRSIGPIQINEIHDLEDARQTSKGVLQVLPVDLLQPASASKLEPGNAPYVLKQLDIAATLCEEGKAAAMVTAPVQKSVINDYGIPFSGHTEYLAKRFSVEQPVMLLTTTQLRVALVTTHLPLSAVPAAISMDTIGAVLKVTHGGMRDLFAIPSPKLAVLGINPHAGEQGHLGREEIEIIEPAVRAAVDEGMDVMGPLPADTGFIAARTAGADVVVAMFHDQGLPVVKTLGFGQVCNVTLGLPIIRTSVDHGTALDIAGQGAADPASLITAVELAVELASRSPIQ